MVTCLLCASPTQLVLDLGTTPLANDLPMSPNQEQSRFPLRLVQCSECKHLQLDYIVDKERLYGPDYVYTTANPVHLERLAERLAERFKPTLAVDIGGNDGLFASMLRQRGVTARNVDPASVPGDGNIQAFFDEETADKIPPADLITCLNAFAHNGDLTPIVKGVKRLLRPGGTFVFEVAYAMPMLRDGLFDLIYHEHAHHWHLRPAVSFFAKHGMQVYDAEEVPTHGGSLRVYVRHRQKGRLPDKLQAMLVQEAAELLSLVEQFPLRAESGKAAATRVFERLSENMERVGLLGYPAKACTLLHYYGIGKGIRYAFDDNPRKQGRYTHFGQRIEPTGSLYAHKPDWLLVTSWNYADELMKRFAKYREMGGRFLVPFPLRAQ